MSRVRAVVRGWDGPSRPSLPQLAQEAVKPPAWAMDDPVTPDIAMHALLVKLHAERGAVELGLAADLYLRGIRTALATCIGPEAARKTMRRHAREKL